MSTSGNAPEMSSTEERRRLRQRRQLAHPNSPQQRLKNQKRLAYHRRHNEKDGRLYYCDYCDLFVSSSDTSWERSHLRSTRHCQNVEAYYALVESLDDGRLRQTRIDVALARQKVEEDQRVQQSNSTANARTKAFGSSPEQQCGMSVVANTESQGKGQRGVAPRTSVLGRGPTGWE